MQNNDIGTYGEMSLTVVRNGRIIDPASNRDETGDLWFLGERIVDAPLNDESEKITVIEAKGKLVLPGIIDMHTHLCEPGYEYRETIESGTRAAVAGGVTALACMPDTDPVIDDVPTVKFIQDRALNSAARIYPIGALTVGSEGDCLTESGKLLEAGVVALSDAERSIGNPAILRRGLEYNRMFNLPIIVHCEDPFLSRDGQINDGYQATRLGLKGSPTVSEETIAARDIMLAEETGGRLHLTHISSAVTVQLIRAAKKRGVQITADVSPLHLVLTDEALLAYDTNLKVTPPLRSQRDFEALREGLLDGTIDAIASDHTPRSVDEKKVEFQEALPGALGLETMLSFIFTELVEPGQLSISSAIKALSTGPAKILGVEGGLLSAGNPADFLIFDPNSTWLVDADSLKSKSNNTPLAGRTLKGFVTRTVVGGKTSYLHR